MKALKLIVAPFLLLTFVNVQSMQNNQITSYVQPFKWACADELQEHEQLVRNQVSDIIRESILYRISNKDKTTRNERFGQVSLLFNACDLDSLFDVVNHLLIMGYSPNEGNTIRSAFEHAIRSNALSNAKLMLKSYNADPKKGILALMDHACLTKSEQLFKAQKEMLAHMLAKLAVRKESPDVQDEAGQTPLMKVMQIKRGSKQIIEIPLTYREELVSMLLKAGASALKKDRDGVSAFDRAKKNNFISIVSMITPMIRKNRLSSNL